MPSPISQTKASTGTVAVIGAGSVGASVSAALLQSGVVREILLVDANEDLCRGQALDLSDSNLVTDSKVQNATFQQASSASIIVITAGVRQRPEETRNQLVDRNGGIFNDICSKLMPVASDTVFIIVTNPCELLAGLFQHISGLPPSRVIGSGTYLDSMRFRDAIANELSIAPSSIHAYIVGEHGDDQIALFSSAQICGVPLLQFPGFDKDKMDHIATNTMRRAYDIIALKGSTFYGVASSVMRISSSIIHNRRQAFCVSVYSPEYDTYISRPTVLGEAGVVLIMPLEGFMNTDERARFDECAKGIKSQLDVLKTKFPPRK